MVSGQEGTFVISWGQSELDGLRAASPALMNVGSQWRWSGQAIRVDAQRDVLRLADPEGLSELHRKAAAQVRRLLKGRAVPGTPAGEIAPDEPLFHAGFELTDGRNRYQATLVRLEQAAHPVVLFAGMLPPAECDLWVLSCTVGADMGGPETVPATVCFVPGTRIATPEGNRRVEELAVGDLVSTRDSGPQPVFWIGDQQISGARLLAMPRLRPVRIAPGALATGEPGEGLVVSPEHRVLMKGQAAELLFNTPEVLVAARDLVNDRSIRICRACTRVRYIHLMLERHQIIWANSLPVESFHPAGMAPDLLPAEQRQALFERFPDLRYDPMRYGAFARRTLTGPEAALFTHEPRRGWPAGYRAGFRGGH